MHEFARILQAIIHGAVQIEKTPRPLNQFEPQNKECRISKLKNECFSHANFYG
jgi:hypothetical protein